MAYLVNNLSSTSLSLQLLSDTSNNTLLTTRLPLPCPHRVTWGRNLSQHIGYHVVKCRLSKVKESPPPSTPSTLIKEPHKYFDQVIITVRSGDGGHGAILTMPEQKAPPKPQGRHVNVKDKKKKSLYKRGSDGSVVLPMGGPGGDVILYADEGKDTLLEFHKKNRHNAKRGGNVDSMGVMTSHLHNGFAAPTLRIPVPIGTVVKRKRGMFIADLTHPGDEILVARGGQGGFSTNNNHPLTIALLEALMMYMQLMVKHDLIISLLDVPEHRRKRAMSLTSNVMRDDSDKVLVVGQPGEEVSLELILRVVADVGLVGLPNAGKSTLLAAITLARPEIANYPFTTLMPNLGRLDGDPSLGAGRYSSEATLADLPGLIEGAHLGKGLGRNFLRHLRRTRVLVHIVDAAADNPAKDYRTVKEELRMYNPEYLERPFIVVLNKMDLPEAKDRLPVLAREISSMGCDDIPSKLETTCNEEAVKSPPQSENADLPSLGPRSRERKEKQIEEYPRPLAVVGVSVLKGINIDEMLKAIRAALRTSQASEEALGLKTSFT